MLEFLRQWSGVTSQQVHDLLVLRLLAQPIFPTVWRIELGAEGWVREFTDHYTHRYGSKRSRKWIYFHVPCYVAELLLPDLYLDLTLPRTLNLVPDSVDKRVRQMVTWDLDDEDESVDEVLDRWEAIDRDPQRFNDQYLQHLETEEVSETMRMGSRYRGLRPMYSEPEVLTDQRLSDRALSYVHMYPKVVSRITYMCEGRMNPLYGYEVRSLQRITEGLVTYTVKGELG